MPAWVDRAVADYSKRLPSEIKLFLKELPLAQRRKGYSAERAMAQEALAIRRAIPERDRIIALDVNGSSWSTGQLAGMLAEWQMSAENYCLLIGGPDGLDPDILREAHVRWSLSPLTLPHPLVRVVLVEQLYRAWTINAKHPYHRD
jgi:23S rRNA (pseudouridine1915-N3)-methyltransferase